MSNAFCFSNPLEQLAPPKPSFLITLEVLADLDVGVLLYARSYSSMILKIGANIQPLVRSV